MTDSYTTSITFTVTHARHLATKVSADLKRMQRFYGSPPDTRIAEFEAELIELLKSGYLDTVTYGFHRSGNYIEPTLRYTARELASENSSDDDPGRVKPGLDVTNASFHSFLKYNAAFARLATADQQKFEASLPLNRSNAAEPGVAGYFSADLTYSAGGRALNRESVRSV